MVTHKRTIVWNPEAEKQLKAACKFIQKDSPQNALKVRDDVVTATRKLSSHPEHYARTNTNDITMVLSEHSKSMAIVLPTRC